MANDSLLPASSIESAFRSTDPFRELRNLADLYLAQGRDRAVVLVRFENARLRLRAANREQDEDALTDVMDILVGWCSPRRKLPREQLDNGARGEQVIRPRAKQPRS